MVEAAGEKEEPSPSPPEQSALSSPEPLPPAAEARRAVSPALLLVAPAGVPAAALALGASRATAGAVASGFLAMAFPSV